MLNHFIFKTGFLLYFFWFWVGFGVDAQEQTIAFTSLSSKNGLSSNTINAILKDHYGFIWFATDDGLNKFDGTTFTVYRHDPGDSASIESNQITSLYEDKSGNLWIGTNGGSLSIYNRKKDNFANLKFNSGDRRLNSTINAIVSDAYGKVWVAHYGGLSIIDPKRSSLFTFPIDPGNNDKLPTKVILSLFEDRQRQMWIGTNKGLLRFDRKTRKFIRYNHDSENSFSLGGDGVKAITQDASGTLWVGTTKGLNMILPSGKDFKSLIQTSGLPSALSNKNIFALAFDNEGRLWIGTEKGLYLLNRKSGEVTELVPNKRNKHSLTSQSIRCIYLDTVSGIYWLGTYQGGINKHDRNLSLFHSKSSDPFDARGLPAAIVTSFAEKNNNETYIGTDGGGLSLFDRRTGLFNHIPIPMSDKSSKDLSVHALEMTRGKKLWIGTYGDGLFLYNTVSSKFTQFKMSSGPASLNHNEVFCIKEDRSGNVWVGTNGGGLNVYNPEANAFVKYHGDFKKESPFYLPINGYIRAITEDKAGNIWIGSHGAGIAMYDRLSKKFTHYVSYNSKLTNNIALSLLSDKNNNIWVGTNGGGLCLFNKKTKQFIAFTEKDGLSNSVVHKIIEDGENKLWLSTNTGISSFDLLTRKFTNYSYYNGVQNSNFVRGAGLRLADGEIFFGGLEGFNYFKPSDLRKNKNIPPVLFTDLKVANRSITPLDSSVLESHISVASEINLDYKQNFSLSFIGLSYTAPQQNQYSYKLEGFDKDWSYPSTYRTASYTNLDPGEYVFRVKASNNNGIWNNEGASIKIIVKPPFWRTIYAYLFYFISIIGLLSYFRYRTLKKLETRFALEQERTLAKQELEQERKEADRIHELDNLKIKFLTNLSHEFRTPISLIMGPVDNLLSTENNEKRVSQLHMVKRNARRLLNLVNQLLDFRKMEEHELRLNLVEGDVVSFIKEVADSFRDLSERKKISFSISSKVQCLFTKFDHDKIERILFNLLSNAFKFTMENGEISLEVDKFEKADDVANTWVTIKVTDTGIGISEDKKEKIFERFFQNSTTVSILNQGTGIGLAITKEFVKMHGGTIEVESEPEKGASFTITLPFVPVDVLKEVTVGGSESSKESEWTFETEIEPLAEASNDYEYYSSGSIVTNRMDVPSILLVEDNDDFRFYLKDNLKFYYKVYEAANGKEGWQKALANHPQLIVSDINMPVMDGIQLARKIKFDKRTSHIPVILLTALTAEEEQLKGLETGANDYMTKPFNFEILNAKIKNLLVLNRTLKDTYTRQIKAFVPEIEVESEDAKLLNKVLLYIEKNINDPKLSVEDLSKHVGMSRSSLYNKIMEVTGQSPVEYIRNVKLDKAAILLEKSDMNVAQVGYVVGFATPNYFAKSFKAKFNMLPSEFVQLKRKGSQFKG
ncbi:hybrid sensor histidine kinase/response regulator transcription factor [Desertivirga xinjiangensis]|uniref:hybrid sensor histidine kinase/response regulator transcription factor n=1 Tax=Desertivirga xinjiangensis TaxID=539206 RepID=UPI00210C2697|nr:hybrid sensor histidine kinase/response regulator transcription factor [Pedobacter xinjiangensis]